MAALLEQSGASACASSSVRGGGSAIVATIPEGSSWAIVAVISRSAARQALCAWDRYQVYGVSRRTREKESYGRKRRCSNIIIGLTGTPPSTVPMPGRACV